MPLNDPPAYSGNDAYLQNLYTYLLEVKQELDEMGLSRNYRDSFISNPVTLESGQEAIITNKRKIKMRYMIPVSESDADAHITKGSTEWTQQYMSVKNQGSETVTVKILFFR